MASSRKRSTDPSTPKRPTTYIAELYGHSPEVFKDKTHRLQAVRTCPVRGHDAHCDVSANRNSIALLDTGYRGIVADVPAIHQNYGKESLPLGICSCWGTRQNETVAQPWILCPKRLLCLEPPRPVIPKEVRDLIDIKPGATVGVWSELKFRRREQDSMRFFEYTFDYLLIELKDGEPVGAPYIIEVMTSSTRGGGLQEHMTDVLLGREQRHLGKIVASIYTPNYRQVFERMIGQFIAKSEIAEKWGGKTIWVFQDTLLDYIEQTTAFSSAAIQQEGVTGNVFCEVYSLVRPPTAPGTAPAGLRLKHAKSIRGRARIKEHSLDFTSFLGLGYAPPLDELKKTLREGYKRSIKAPESSRIFTFTWGQELDPRLTEPAMTEIQKRPR